MGRIVSHFFITLDGVVESPEEWQFPYFDEDVASIVHAGTSAAAFLMGRRLYDGWVQHWPRQGSEVFFADFINTVPKYVLSSTLTDPTWHHTSVLGGLEEVRRLKESVDGEIAMSGSATTVRVLLAQGLLDELDLLVHPIVVGAGQRLFERVDAGPSFRLLASRALGSGVLHLRYAPTCG